MTEPGDVTEPALPGPGYFNPISFAGSLVDPTDLMLAMRSKYGDTFRLPTIFGPVVVTGDPDAIRDIFTADPDSFVPYQTESTAPVFGETSLANVSGARHRRDRKLLMPPFHGARMRAYSGAMAESAARATGQWTEGAPFKMIDTTQEISLDIILRTVFGFEHDSAEGKAVREAVIRYVGSLRPTFLFMPWMRRDFFGLSAWARFKKTRDHLDSLLYAAMAERRREGAERDDILSLMMKARHDDGSAMSEKELRDQLISLLFAGHETTAMALAWALYWLHREPGELERALAEIDALGPSPDPEAFAGLPFLDAVCQETLRIHPIAPEIPRLLARPLKVRDWMLPAGTAIVVSVILVHRREDLYPEPERFLPSRFLDRKMTPFEHVPFGGGARRCLGAAFAQHEMKIVLGTILRSRRLRPASSDRVKPVRRGFTMGPRGGVPMIYEGPRAT